MPIIECPHCECNDIVKSGSTARWGKSWQRWRCNFCRRVWSSAPTTRPETISELPAVDYYVIACPHCGSDRTAVRKTMTPIRYHECNNCKKTFKSYEKRA